MRTTAASRVDVGGAVGVRKIVAPLAMPVDPQAGLRAEVQAFEHVHDAQRLLVVPESHAAVRPHRFVQGALARVTEGRVPHVVPERDRLDQILVQPQRASDRAGDLRHLQSMGQARPVVVAERVDKHLRLVLQAAEGFRVQDAVAVALKGGSHGVGRFGSGAACGIPRAGGVGGERLALPALDRFADGVGHCLFRTIRKARIEPMTEVPSPPDVAVLMGEFKGVSAEEVFAWLTDPARLVQWWPERAEVDLRVGGAYAMRWSEHPEWTIQGEYAAVEAPGHLAFTWRGDPDGREATHVDVWIDDLEECARLAVWHRGFADASERRKLCEGWIHFGMRLMGVAEPASADVA